MSIYTKARAKITIGTVLLSLSIIIGAWLMLFATDYVLYKNNMPLLFASTTIEEINNKHITVEKGIGYYVIVNEENISEIYLFGHKIK